MNLFLRNIVRCKSFNQKKYNLINQSTFLFCEKKKKEIVFTSAFNTRPELTPSHLSINIKERINKQGELTPELYNELITYFSRPIGKDKLPNEYKIPVDFISYALNRSKTSEDFDFALSIILDMYNNKQIISSSLMDIVAVKSLELGFPEKMNDIFKHHRAFHYFPNTDISSNYLNYYIVNNLYESFIKFIDSVEKSYYIFKSNEFYNKAIKFCIDNKDNDTIVKLFLSIIDYSNMEILYINEIIYSNSHINKDEVFITLVTQYLSYHKNQNSIGINFALMTYYLSNKSTDKVDELIAEINKLIENDKVKNKEILYNRTIKLVLREYSGSEQLSKLNKNILEYMVESMKVNIFDLNEKSVQEPEEPVKQKKAEISKAQKAAKVVSFNIEVKTNPFTISDPLPSSEMKLVGHKPGEKKKAKKKEDDDDEDDSKGKKKGGAKK